MKEKTPGFCFSGFLIMMLMPRFINGLLKSMTRSRVDDIVSGAIARSASCQHAYNKNSEKLTRFCTQARSYLLIYLLDACCTLKKAQLVLRHLCL